MVSIKMNFHWRTWLLLLDSALMILDRRMFFLFLSHKADLKKIKPLTFSPVIIREQLLMYALVNLTSVNLKSPERKHGPKKSSLPCKMDELFLVQFTECSYWNKVSSGKSARHCRPCSWVNKHQIVKDAIHCVTYLPFFLATYSFFLGRAELM